jgi:site-specific DNA recombinase
MHGFISFSGKRSPAKGATTKRGKPMSRSDVYRILTNRMFWGEALHKGNSDPGEFSATITPVHWDTVLAIQKITPYIMTSSH